MRAVIDTNIFIASLLGNLPSRKVILKLQEGQFKLLLSEALFKELQFVLGRPKILGAIGQARKEEFLLFIKSTAVFVRPAEQVNACRDVEDNKVLEAALEGADAVVSLDKDILDLHTFRGIPLITPSAFLKLLPKI